MGVSDDVPQVCIAFPPEKVLDEQGASVGTCKGFNCLTLLHTR